MIKQVTIENFQSLRDVTAELGQFTVILGESDLGKSAFIRAIHSAVTNQTGQGFIRTGQEETRVAIHMPEAIIEWTKSKSAEYVTKSDTQTLFERVRGVPDPIRTALQLGSIECGDVEINPNFHTQFDTPFLVSDTASVRAKVLGELSGINLLFLATQEARRLDATAKKEAGFKLGELDKQKELLKQYASIDDTQSRISIADGLLAEAAELSLSATIIDNLIDRIQMGTEELINLTVRLSALNNSLTEFDALTPSDEDLEALRDFIEDIPATANTLVGLQLERHDYLKQISKIEVELSKVKVCPTCGKPLL